MPLWFVIQGTKPERKHISYGLIHLAQALIKCHILENMPYNRVLTWRGIKVILKELKVPRAVATVENSG